jgi:hypothetical protein
VTSSGDGLYRGPPRSLRGKHYPVRMTDPVDYELPDCYRLTYLDLNGTTIKNLPHPVIPADDDVLLIEIEPIHPDPVTEMLLVTLQELRQIEARWKDNRLNLIAPLSGAEGVSAGEIKLGRQLLERIRREQARRQAKRHESQGQDLAHLPTLGLS